METTSTSKHRGEIVLQQAETMVPLPTALKWSENWINHKPSSILPNSALVDKDTLLHFLDTPGINSVVVFLGMETITKEGVDSNNHMRVFLHGAKRTADADMPLQLVGSKMALVLGDLSFDPLPKSSISVQTSEFVGQAHQGGPIDPQTALEWVENWERFKQKGNFDFPQYLVFTDQEVKDLAKIPGVDSLRMLTVYKPKDGAEEESPFQLDFIFFGAIKTPGNEYSAVNVLLPSEKGGHDKACVCPPDRCCNTNSNGEPITASDLLAAIA